MRELDFTITETQSRVFFHCFFTILASVKINSGYGKVKRLNLLQALKETPKHPI